MKGPRTGWLVLLGLLCLTSILRADEILLKNGRVMEGEILFETPEAITLKMGPAQVILKQNQIASIRRSSSEEQAEKKKALKKKYFDHEDYVDPELTEEALAYRSLKRSVQAGMKAQGDLKVHAVRAKNLERERDRITNQRASLANEILSRGSQERIEEYNLRINEHNRLQFRLVALQKSHKISLEKMQENRIRIRSAIQKTRETRKMFSERQGALEPLNEAQNYFFNQADVLMASADALHKKIDLEFIQSGDHAIVDVILNHEVTARLMVDTGASVITISEDIAGQLELIRQDGYKLPMRLADGKTVDMEPVVIQHVAVGGAERENIAAVIVPDRDEAIGSEVDGLLGMSFLRNFDLNINPANGKIQLIDYNP